jgi:catechol 2,3-dioxygenase-like lactoylglutathione lyase family enzyme
MLMEPRISLITLGVADLGRAVRFYRDGLSFPTTYQDGDPIAFFATNGTRFAVFPLDDLAADIGPNVPMAGRGFGGVTLSHNVRAEEEVATVLALAEQAGGTIVKPAQVVEVISGRNGYFTDPDGYYWEVAWNPMFPFASDGSLILNP